MQDKQTSQENPERTSVRIDLTSQDLRTGVIRLPRQLHNSFEPGDLTATTTPAGEQLQLTFTPPRELAGLQGLLADLQLRPNDALILHIAGSEVSLEPHFRNRGQVTQADQPEQTVEPSTGAPAESAAAEPDGDKLPVEEVQADLPAKPQTVEEATPLAPAEELPPASNETSDTEATEPGQDATVAVDDWSAEEDPFGSFDSFSDDSFEDSGFAHQEPEDFDLPEVPAWTAPAETVQEARQVPATEKSGPVQAGYSASGYHTLQRRQFGSRPVAAADSTPDAELPISSSQAESVEDSASAAAPPSARRQLIEFINDPAAPSIMRASELSRKFSVPVETVEAALREVSEEPDSRLSNIRPDYWLMKRKTA